MSESADFTPHPWQSETWDDFRDSTGDDLEWLIPGLLPAGALGFIAAAPKKGKTWLALTLALSVVTGRDLFGEFPVREEACVYYVALEGARAGLRARIGALARGLGIDPDKPAELEALSIAYRPRPFNLVDHETIGLLREDLDGVGFDRLIIIDVLRQAARIKENEAESFALVREKLDPLLAEGRTVVLCHHFGKHNDTQAERLPGERMAGSGAMYGGLDVGFFITKSESGARRLRVDVDARDFAAPDPLGVVIVGTGSGEHGGFTYRDTATVILDQTAAEGRDLVTELEQLFADCKWRTLTELASKKDGIGANRDEIKEALEATPDRFVQVDGPAVGRHVNAKPWGTVAMFQGVAQIPEQDEQDDLFQDVPSVGGNVLLPYGERTRATRSTSTSGLAPESEQDQNGHVDDAYLEELARTEDALELERAEPGL